MENIKGKYDHPNSGCMRNQILSPPPPPKGLGTRLKLCQSGLPCCRGPSGLAHEIVELSEWCGHWLVLPLTTSTFAGHYSDTHTSGGKWRVDAGDHASRHLLVTVEKPAIVHNQCYQKLHENSWTQLKPLRMIRISSLSANMGKFAEQLSNCEQKIMNSTMNGF